MKILTEKTIVSMKNEIIIKIYNALVEYNEILYIQNNPGSEVFKGHNHDEVLKLALKHFYEKPTGYRVYGWCHTQNLDNLIP